MGGTDDPSNLIKLTVEEHAEAHRKLFEQYGHWQDEVAWKGLAKMIDRTEIIYQTISKTNSLKQKGSGNSQFGTVWCVIENATDCSNRKKFARESIPEGWITTKEFKKRKLSQKHEARKQSTQLRLTQWHQIYCEYGFDQFVKITNYPHSQQNLVQQFAKWVPKFVPQNGKKRQNGIPPQNRTATKSFGDSYATTTPAGNNHKMVGVENFEISTYRLKARYSASELHTRLHNK